MLTTIKLSLGTIWFRNSQPYMLIGNEALFLRSFLITLSRPQHQ